MIEVAVKCLRFGEEAEANREILDDSGIVRDDGRPDQYMRDEGVEILSTVCLYDTHTPARRLEPCHIHLGFWSMVNNMRGCSRGAERI